MAHGADKYRSRRNRARVREIFWLEWDPIGVNECENAKDEYDRYADRSYVMLMDEGRSAPEIADYLYYISSEHMGLGPSEPLRVLAAKIAERLMTIRPELEKESNDPF